MTWFNEHGIKLDDAIKCASPGPRGPRHPDGLLACVLYRGMGPRWYKFHEYQAKDDDDLIVTGYEGADKKMTWVPFPGTAS
jgi:hypothetical protein